VGGDVDVGQGVCPTCSRRTSSMKAAAPFEWRRSTSDAKEPVESQGIVVSGAVTDWYMPSVFETSAVRVLGLPLASYHPI
jgi:hypothetical protein